MAPVQEVMEIFDEVFWERPFNSIKIQHKEPMSETDRRPGCMCGFQDRVHMSQRDSWYLTYLFNFHMLDHVKFLSKPYQKIRKTGERTVSATLSFEPVPTYVLKNIFDDTKANHTNCIKRLVGSEFARLLQHSERKRYIVLTELGFGRVLCDSHFLSVNSFSLEHFKAGIRRNRREA